MEYLNTDNLTIKGNKETEGANAYIRQALLGIPTGKSLRMADLAQDVMENFETSGKTEKDRRMRIYIRIGDQYKKLVSRGKLLTKAVDGNGYTRVLWDLEKVKEAEAVEFGL